jgi:uncharacterized membrane protein
MDASWIAGFWLLFAATHLGLSGRHLRPRLVARLGDRGFQGLYSLVALATFVPLVWSYYAHPHAGPYLWNLGRLAGVGWMVQRLGYGLIGAAFVLVVAGLVQPSPASMRPGQPEVRGVARITRHPLFMGIGLWAVAHLLLVVVNVSELLFFGGFAVFSVVGCDHQDQRKVAELGERYRSYVAATPFLPFSTLGSLRGLVEMPMPVAVAVGIALAWAVRQYAHAWLSG